MLWHCIVVRKACEMVAMLLKEVVMLLRLSTRLSTLIKSITQINSNSSYSSVITKLPRGVIVPPTVMRKNYRRGFDRHKMKDNHFRHTMKIHLSHPFQVSSFLEISYCIELAFDSSGPVLCDSVFDE